MRKILTLTIISLIIFACSKKSAAVKTITEKTESTTVTNEQYLIGKSVYVSKCGKCHQLKDPGRGNMNQWDKWLNKMAPKAKLTDEQKTQIRDYISVNAK